MLQKGTVKYSFENRKCEQLYQTWRTEELFYYHLTMAYLHGLIPIYKQTHLYCYCMLPLCVEISLGSRQSFSASLSKLYVISTVSNVHRDHVFLVQNGLNVPLPYMEEKSNYRLQV